MAKSSDITYTGHNRMAKSSDITYTGHNRMPNSSDITFVKTLHTLDQILGGRSHEFPLVVKTRNKMLSFQETSIEDEGKVLYLEREMSVKYARIKVLPFHDEDRIVAERGAEAFHLHRSFVGEEFYIPLHCPGKLRIVPYSGRRHRYATVTEIMKDNPRYLKSNVDVITIIPKELSGHDYKRCISADTILEPRAIIYHNNNRYLNCVDTNGNNYLLQENCRINFTDLPDENDYALEELWSSCILLPTPVQFNPATISPNDVVLFDDTMANNNLVITSGPLEVIEVISMTVLVAMLRQSKSRCFKMVLIPRSMYKDFHVHQASFQSVEKKSIYLEKKFGGCRGDNTFVLNTMYLFPVEDGLVCMLRSPKHLSGRVHFCDSSDSDSDYEIPEEPEEHQDLPPLPERNSVKVKRQRELEDKLRELHTVVLLPSLKIQDKDAIQRLKEKAKLGFLNVHDELKRRINRKHKLKLTSKSFDSSCDTHETSAKPKLPEPCKTERKLNRSKSAQETSLPSDIAVDTYRIQSQSRNKNRPLPSLPREQETTNPMYEGRADEAFKYDYVDVTGREQPEVGPKLTPKVTARVRPMSNPDKTGRALLSDTTGTEPPKLQRCYHSQETKSSQLSSDIPDVYYDCYIDMSQNKSTDLIDDEKEPVTTTSFFNYSVQETVECLNLCGLKELAEVCEEQKLDGEFFKTTDELELKELLNLSGLGLLKLKKVFDGWRPKF